MATALAATAVTTCAGEKSEAVMLSIPTVDISGERERHVVVNAGTDDLYHGHANTALLPDRKTMLCVWTLNHGWASRSSNAATTRARRGPNRSDSPRP
jgi:hypothetical protein